jgi:hypothetical protein
MRRSLGRYSLLADENHGGCWLYLSGLIPNWFRIKVTTTYISCFSFLLLKMEPYVLLSVRWKINPVIYIYTLRGVRLGSFRSVKNYVKLMLIFFRSLHCTIIASSRFEAGEHCCQYIIDYISNHWLVPASTKRYKSYNWNGITGIRQLQVEHFSCT